MESRWRMLRNQRVTMTSTEAKGFESTGVTPWPRGVPEFVRDDEGSIETRGDVTPQEDLPRVPAELARWADRLAAAGIDARRWCSPALIAQLRDAPKHPINTVVCNLLDGD